mmetsp:Transcript_59057/g.97652  ORF Transcript_59057/g.97652 Transcript_59057/m.97652 type:complete len:216 (+) Transcript_59057:69-716(+)
MNSSKKEARKPQESEDVISRGHMIYFYSPFILPYQCNTNKCKKDHGDRVFVQIPELSQEKLQLTSVYRGYPYYGLYYQLRSIHIEVAWTLKHRVNGLSLFFYQTPCGCGKPCCRGKDRKLIRHTKAKGALKFGDGGFYYKIVPPSDSVVELYHFPKPAFNTRRLIFDEELFKNTKSLVIRLGIRPPAPKLRNAIGKVIDVAASDSRAFNQQYNLM